MANPLTTTTDSQSQTTAQAGNLQPTGQASLADSGSSGDLQPETANSVLTSQQGVTLHSTSLPQVSLSTPAPPLPLATATTASTAKPAHHANSVFLGFSGLLFVVAVVLFWTTSRSVKNTT